MSNDNNQLPIGIDAIHTESGIFLSAKHLIAYLNECSSVTTEKVVKEIYLHLAAELSDLALVERNEKPENENSAG